jgi:hypothetical protein
VLLSALLFETAAVQTYEAPKPVFFGFGYDGYGIELTRDNSSYFDWRRQAPCLEALRDATRGSCWVTFRGALPQGWKRSITAPIAVEKLKPLGVDDLSDYQVVFDPAGREFIVAGWAADPKGPTYPAGVFASVEGIGDFRQISNFTTLEQWEKLSGRAREADTHTLGFNAKFSETVVAPTLDQGKPVTVRSKIAAFDLSGYYSPRYFYRIEPNRAITRIVE